METAQDLEGMNIARRVAARAEARRILAARRIPFSPWTLAVLVVTAAASGHLLVDAGPTGTLLTGILAAVGAVLGLVACALCIRLNARLDAALKLLDPEA